MLNKCCVYQTLIFMESMNIVDQIFSDVTFSKKPRASRERLSAEGSFPIGLSQTRRKSEHAVFIKTTIATDNVNMRIVSKNIAKALYGDNGPGHCIIPRNRCLKKDLQIL